MKQPKSLCKARERGYLADYKRFVSYMYEYENGVKKKNVGYARVEIRNGECKIKIHMRLEGLLDGIFPTYLIHRPLDEMDLVYIGDGMVKNQLMDSRLTVSENNVMDSGLKFSSMGGILLFLNSGVFYATQWDDKAVILGEVLEALKPKPMEKNRDMTDIAKQENQVKEHDKKLAHKDGSSDMKADTDTKVTEVKSADTEKVSVEVLLDIDLESSHSKQSDIDFLSVDEKQSQIDAQVSDKEQAHIDMTSHMKPVDTDIKVSTEKVADTDKKSTVEVVADIDTKVSNLKPSDIKTKVSEGHKSWTDDLSIPVYKLPRGWKTKEGFQQKSQKAPINPWDLVDRYKEHEGKVRQELKTDQKDIEPKDNISKDFALKDSISKETFIKDEIRKDNEQATTEKTQEDKLKAAKSADYTDKRTWEQKSSIKEETDRENPLAARIFANFPRIYPFEDNVITKCVKIEPKDIGTLPSETWALSNNSFLLHGYYCYHHLIFAEIKDRYGAHYILGVPGIYHNRERFMARMFGFDCFKSIRKRELRQGDFGYWYVEINI